MKTDNKTIEEITFEQLKSLSIKANKKYGGKQKWS